MPLEIEAKMKVADAADQAAIEQRLRDAGAKPIGSFFERNYFFDTADRSLLAGGSGLRLRVAAVAGKVEPMRVLTFKGPRQPGPMKSREEIELAVSDADTALTMLQRLGFDHVLLFEKRRQSWSLDRCRIELDEVPHLGRFVEIEGPDEATVLAMRGRLQLSDRPLVNEGYAGLLVEHLQQRGLPVGQIVFDPGSV